MLAQKYNDLSALASTLGIRDFAMKEEGGKDKLKDPNVIHPGQQLVIPNR